MAPSVSVLINNHNYARFLGEAIDSVLSQEDCPTPEVVVVDDGSDDDSRAVVESYGARVRGVFQPRRGQTAAVNRGFAESGGEVVFLLDADDAWRPGKISRVLAEFADPAVGAVQHLLHDSDAALNPLPRRFPRWPARYRLEDLLAGRVEWTAVSGTAFRREILARALPLPEEMFFYLDDWMLSRALFFGEVANVPETLALRRVHGANWYAGAFGDVKKLEADLANRAIYRRALDAWLGERGLTLSPAAAETERLELSRRKILLDGLRGRPAAALREWRAGLPAAARSPHALFRAATTLLAALWPSLYLALYRAYGAGPWRAWRQALFPERA